MAARAPAETALATVGSVGGLAIKVTKGNHSPWEEKWQFMLHQLHRLREAYDGGHQNIASLDVEGWANNFFVECEHLVEWLSGNVASLGGVTKKEIKDHRRTSGPLRRCTSIAEAHKHYGKRSDGTPLGRIQVIESGQAWRVTIALDWPAPEPSLDALELAEECVAAWRAFFEEHGIEEPPTVWQTQSAAGA